MATLTADEVRHLLDYEPATGVFRWRVSTSKRVKVGDVAGCVVANGYRKIRINKRLWLEHRLVWLHQCGAEPSAELDHINGDRADNRLINLRVADRTSNARNCRGHKDSRSGRKGVHWDTTGKKWGARICVDRKQIYLGNFETVEQAAAAYDAAAMRHHGDFAKVNGG